jgi:ribosomal protein L3 glutamine methyltransferase
MARKLTSTSSELPVSTHRTLPADTTALQTVRDWLRYAVSLFTAEKLFFGQGSASAFDEAAFLIRHTLHLPHEGLATFYDARVTPSEATALRTVLERRAYGREPAAYITGEAWLGEYSFRVDRRVIVPRSYFLELIPEELNKWLSDPEGVTSVADVCTGSGCLAILLAMAYPEATVDAVDISADALEVAALNVEDYHFADRIALHKADVLDGVVPAEPYDIIICNPPYEPESVLATLPSEFLHEPENALVSGVDGMDVIRRLLPQSAERLKERGILLIEVGGLQDAMHAEWPELDIHWLKTSDESDCVCLIHASELRRVFPVKAKKSAKPKSKA